MPTLFWDASGLVKRYTEEVGNGTAEALFHQLPRPRMVTTFWGYSETFSLLLRKPNDGRLSLRLFGNAVSRLRYDMMVLPLFRLLTVTGADIVSSITYIQRHNINSTDAALLTTLLRYARTTGEACALVAADSCLCRATQAEGLAALNPQDVPTADVPARLAALTD